MAGTAGCDGAVAAMGDGDVLDGAATTVVGWFADVSMTAGDGVALGVIGGAVIPDAADCDGGFAPLSNGDVLDGATSTLS